MDLRYSFIYKEYAFVTSLLFSKWLLRLNWPSKKKKKDKVPSYELAFNVYFIFLHALHVILCRCNPFIEL